MFMLNLYRVHASVSLPPSVGPKGGLSHLLSCSCPVYANCLFLFFFLNKDNIERGPILSKFVFDVCFYIGVWTDFVVMRV